MSQTDPLSATPRLTPRDIPTVLHVACNVCGCSTDDLYSRSRHPSMVAARQIVVRLLRDNSHLSFPEIARVMGRENHSTTITQYQRIESLLKLPRGDAWRLVQVTSRTTADIGEMLELAEMGLGLGKEMCLP